MVYIYQGISVLCAAVWAWVATSSVMTQPGNTHQRRLTQSTSLLGKTVWGVKLQAHAKRLVAQPLVATLMQQAPLLMAQQIVAREIKKRGRVLDTEELQIIVALGLLAVLVVPWIIFGISPLVVVFYTACVLCYVLYLRIYKQREKRELIEAMPVILRTLSVGLAAGQTLQQAIAYVGAHSAGQAGEAFAEASLRMHCGMSLEEATTQLTCDLNHMSADLLGSALVISHRTGAPLQQLLMRSAALVEKQAEFERLLLVKTAQVRLSVRIVVMLPVLMVLMLMGLSPDFVQGLLTPFGITCLVIAAVLDGSALVVIRILMRRIWSA